VATDAPEYDSYQSAFHTAFRPELYRVVDALPVPAGGCVIDVPCGNGFYTRRLAERMAGGRLVAADASDEYLNRAREALTDAPPAVEVEVTKADAYRLPFPDGTFDLAWCAQSLISLQPEPAVRELFRVTRPEGVAVILEADEFHHVLLPWPVALEAALPAAVHAASVNRYGDGAKLAPARRLRGLLRRCGFRSIRRTTHTTERVGPFDPPTAAFLTHHLRFLRSLVAPHLAADLLTTFDRLADPDAPDSFFRSPEVELVCLNVVYVARPLARKPTPV
jgi:ubiquinone/menaquinone biosynthesis C-methylase UbiE